MLRVQKILALVLFAFLAAPFAAADSVDIETTGVDGIGETWANLTGRVNPNSEDTDVAASFVWGIDDADCKDLGNGGNVYKYSGDSWVSYSENISDLTPGTTYFYCAAAAHRHGSSSITREFGLKESFTTQSSGGGTQHPPSVSTAPATNIGENTVTLNGEVNPRGAATAAWFRYWPEANFPGSCTDTGGTKTPNKDVGSGTSFISIEQDLNGLTAETTYYFCAYAENSGGKENGGEQMFATDPPQTPLSISNVRLNTAETGMLGIGFDYSTPEPGEVTCTVNTESCTYPVNADETGTGSCTVDNPDLNLGENTVTCEISAGGSTDQDSHGFVFGDAQLSAAQLSVQNNELHASCTVENPETSDVTLTDAAAHIQIENADTGETVLAEERLLSTVSPGSTGTVSGFGFLSLNAYGTYTATCTDLSAAGTTLDTGPISDTVMWELLGVNAFTVDPGEVVAGDTIDMSGTVEAAPEPPIAWITVENNGEQLENVSASLRKQQGNTYRFTTLYDVPEQERFLGDVSFVLHVTGVEDSVTQGRVVRVSKPQIGAFKVNISVIPEKQFYRTTETVTVEAVPQDRETGEPVAVDKVWCGVHNTRENPLEAGAGNVYTADYKLPRNVSGTVSLRCEAVKTVVNELVAGRGLKQVSVNNTLTFELVEPRSLPDLSDLEGREITLKFNAVYADGTPATSATVTVYANGNAITTQNSTGRTHAVTFTAPEQLETLEIAAVDDAGNTARENVAALGREGVLPLVLIAGVLILALSGATFYTYRKLRKQELEKALTKRGRVEEELAETEERLREIKAAKKETQKRYFKRIIDESTFKETMQDFEHEQNQVKQRINALRATLQDLPEKYELDKTGVQHKLDAVRKHVEEARLRGGDVEDVEKQVEKLQRALDATSDGDSRELKHVYNRLKQVAARLEQK